MFQSLFSIPGTKCMHIIMRFAFWTKIRFYVNAKNNSEMHHFISCFFQSLYDFAWFWQDNVLVNIINLFPTMIASFDYNYQHLSLFFSFYFHSNLSKFGIKFIWRKEIEMNSGSDCSQMTTSCKCAIINTSTAHFYIR